MMLRDVNIENVLLSKIYSKNRNPLMLIAPCVPLLYARHFLFKIDQGLVDQYFCDERFETISV
jgi:hypothetical protein